MSDDNSRSSDPAKDAAMKHSLFLNNLEQWIDNIISQDGLADKELIETIRDKFECAMQANIDHHKFMMNSAKENHNQMLADRHKLMVEIYQSFLQPDQKK